MRVTMEAVETQEPKLQIGPAFMFSSILGNRHCSYSSQKDGQRTRIKNLPRKVNVIVYMKEPKHENRSLCN